MRIPMTDDRKMSAGFYWLAQAFIQAYPVMSPWEIVNWLEHRIGECLSAEQVGMLESAWNKIGRRSWSDLMYEHQVSKSIV